LSLAWLPTNQALRAESHFRFSVSAARRG
jgi:hypothetical protein